jgi:uncharacterized protein (DUF58 family)
MLAGSWATKLIAAVLFIVLVHVNSLFALLLIFLLFIGFILDLGASIDVKVKRKPRHRNKN